MADLGHCVYVSLCLAVIPSGVEFLPYSFFPSPFVCVYVFITMTPFRGLPSHGFESLVHILINEDPTQHPSCLQPCSHPSHRMWSENPTRLELPSAPGRIREQICDAADILGVYIIFQIGDHWALSPWSQKELAALPCHPKTRRRKGVTWLWPRDLLALTVKQQHNGTFGCRGFGVVERAKIVVA